MLVRQRAVAASGFCRAAATEHPARPQNVAIAGDKDGAMAVQVRRGERGGQIVGDQHVTERGLDHRLEARPHDHHLDQAAGNSGRLDLVMGHRKLGLGDKAQATALLALENFDCAQRELRRFDDHGLSLIAQHGADRGPQLGLRVDYVEQK